MNYEEFYRQNKCFIETDISQFILNLRDYLRGTYEINKSQATAIIKMAYSDDRYDVISDLAFKCKVDWLKCVYDTTRLCDRYKTLEAME
jgi:hypothetical protein